MQHKTTQKEMQHKTTQKEMQHKTTQKHRIHKIQDKKTNLQRIFIISADIRTESHGQFLSQFATVSLSNK
jgi:hypothetical protein